MIKEDSVYKYNRNKNNQEIGYQTIVSSVLIFKLIKH